MRVLIDTNVFLSYMLAPSTHRSITAVVTLCFTSEQIELLVPPAQIEEFAAKAANKRYFRNRLPQEMIDNFIAHLTAFSALLPPPEEVAAYRYSRDDKDDYLVAYAIVNEADFLITGDKDLLVLGRVGKLQIVSASQFLRDYSTWT